MAKQHLADTIRRLSESVPSSLDASTVRDLEHVTVKELRQFVAQQPGIVNPMTEKASVVSVIIWIILADAPGGPVINPGVKPR